MERLSIRRLLQRYAAGAGGSHFLDQALRSEVQRLAEADALLEPQRQELRRFSSDRLEAFHDGLFAALRRLDGGEFAAAFDQIRRADAALADLHLLQTALLDHREAENRWAELRERLGLGSLASLPTLRIPERLLALSLVHLAGGCFRKSSVISRVCRQLLDRFFHCDTRASERLSERIRKLGQDLLAAGLPEVRHLSEVERVAGLGFQDLASRLADDLEVDWLGWRAQAQRGQRTSSALIRDIEEIARQAASIQQTFRDWLPETTADST